MCRSAEFLDEGSEGWEGDAEAERKNRAVASQPSGQCAMYLYFSSMEVPPWYQMFLIGELLGWNDVGENEEATIIIQRKVRTYKRSESGCPERVFIKEVLCNRSHVQSSDWQRIGDYSESENLRIREEVVKSKCQH